MSLKIDNGDPNAQTTAFGALMTWPGMLWWLLPVIFFGTIAFEYWWSGLPTEWPKWFQFLGAGIGAAVLGLVVVGAVRSSKAG